MSPCLTFVGVFDVSFVSRYILSDVNDYYIETQNWPNQKLIRGKIIQPDGSLRGQTRIESQVENWSVLLYRNSKTGKPEID